MSTAWQVPQLTSDRVLQQLLRRCTMAAPMPRVPPVTSARLPLNSVSEELFIRVSPLERPFAASGGSTQNRTGGMEPGTLTSVETLTSRQRSASAARAASAWPANCTASLPSKRWAGRWSLAARRRMT
jgi:hypothetical protein